MGKLIHKFEYNNFPASFDVFVKLKNIHTHNIRQQNTLEYSIPRHRLCIGQKLIAYMRLKTLRMINPIILDLQSNTFK